MEPGETKDNNASPLLDVHQTGGDDKIRPSRIEDYPGQPKLVRQIEIAVKAAIARNDSLDHILLSGPPGLGKTTLAHIVANQMGVNLLLTSGPNLRKPGDLVSQLVSLEDREILFIDEIHRMDRTVEEILYPAMEDYKIDIISGRDDEVRKSITLPLSKITVIGATTRPGMLQAPLRDRFGINLQFDYYQASDLAKIISRSAQILGVHMDEDSLMNLASRSRGTPRIANRLLSRCRDWVQVETDHPHMIYSQDVNDCLEISGVDSSGLDDRDNRLLLAMGHMFAGKAVGLATLAASLGEETETIADSVEPYLLREGYIARTPSGRILTEKGFQHIKK